MRFLLWQINLVIVIAFAFEASCWLLLEGIGPPKYTYYASYMNDYKYHPYMAFHPEVYPVYQSKKSGKQLVILGGSTAAGVGPAHQEDSFFRVMENELSLSLKNFAAPGYVSNQEQAAYKNFVFSHSPEMVLTLTSFNDIYFISFARSKLATMNLISHLKKYSKVATQIRRNGKSE